MSKESELKDSYAEFLHKALMSRGLASITTQDELLFHATKNAEYAAMIVDRLDKLIALLEGKNE